jgi:hypothetical protein
MSGLAGHVPWGKQSPGIPCAKIRLANSKRRYKSPYLPMKRAGILLPCGTERKC